TSWISDFVFPVPRRSPVEARARGPGGAVAVASARTFAGPRGSSAGVSRILAQTWLARTVMSGSAGFVSTWASPWSAGAGEDAAGTPPEAVAAAGLFVAGAPAVPVAAGAGAPAGVGAGRFS